jgi:preprotein translocase subunit SecD
MIMIPIRLPKPFIVNERRSYNQRTMRTHSLVNVAAVFVAAMALTACHGSAPGTGTGQISVRTVTTSAPATPDTPECKQPPRATAPGRILVACDASHTLVYTLGPQVVVLRQTHAESRQNATGYGVVVTVDQASQEAFASYTSANVGRETAFVLDGTVIGAPQVNVPVNSAQLEMSTAGETAAQADDIVKSLRG